MHACLLCRRSPNSNSNPNSNWHVTSMPAFLNLKNRSTMTQLIEEFLNVSLRALYCTVCRARRVLCGTVLYVARVAWYRSCGSGCGVGWVGRVGRQRSGKGAAREGRAAGGKPYVFHVFHRGVYRGMPFFYRIFWKCRIGENTFFLKEFLEICGRANRVIIYLATA